MNDETVATGAFNLRDIPIGIREDFKRVCKENKVGMADALINFMKDVVKGVSKPKSTASA